MIFIPKNIQLNDWITKINITTKYQLTDGYFCDCKQYG